MHGVRLCKRAVYNSISARVLNCTCKLKGYDRAVHAFPSARALLKCVHTASMTCPFPVIVIFRLALRLLRIQAVFQSTSFVYLATLNFHIIIQALLSLALLTPDHVLVLAILSDIRIAAIIIAIANINFMMKET